jgi:hypothetical protein
MEKLESNNYLPSSANRKKHYRLQLLSTNAEKISVVQDSLCKFCVRKKKGNFVWKLNGSRKCEFMKYKGGNS